MLTSSLLFSGIAIIVKVIAAQVACRIVVESLVCNRTEGFNVHSRLEWGPCRWTVLSLK